MKLIFVRHGKDDDKYRGGWNGLDLIPEGREQAQKLAKYIAENKENYNITKILSSDLLRTMSTALAVAEELGLRIEKDEVLREMNNGDLAGMLNDEALVKYPGLYFNTLKMDEPYPNGESPCDFFKRIEKWFTELVKEYENSNENILVVTHSGVINIIHHIVKKVEWINTNNAYKISNCGIHVLNVVNMKFEVENNVQFLHQFL